MLINIIYHYMSYIHTVFKTWKFIALLLSHLDFGLRVVKFRTLDEKNLAFQNECTKLSTVCCVHNTPSCSLSSGRFHHTAHQQDTVKQWRRCQGEVELNRLLLYFNDYFLSVKRIRHDLQPNFVCFASNANHCREPNIL